MAITLPEALYLLRALNVETVRVDDLINTFLQQQTTQPEPEPEPELEELPPAPEPPKAEPTYETYAEAKKAAKKGQKPVKNEAGEWVVM